MKQLQNNFTTPKQSKQLLELGVPRWSADEYRDQGGHRFSLDVVIDVKLFFRSFPDYIPCWSVGRLIEIYLTCALEYHPYDDFYTETPSLHLMAFDKDRLIEEVIEIMSEDEMDFLKLEE